MNICWVKLHSHIRMFDYTKTAKHVASRVIFLSVKKMHAINSNFFVQHKRLYYGKLNQFRVLAGSTRTARECFCRFTDDAEWKLFSDIFLSPNLTSPNFGLRESHQGCSCRTLSIKNEDQGLFFAMEFIILVRRTSRLVNATLDEMTRRS